MNNNVLNEWDDAAVAASPITTEMLDQLGKEYKQAWDAVEAHEALGKPIKLKANELEAKLVEAMTQANKEKYFVEGIGTFSFTDRLSVQTPKTNDDKQKLAQYLEEKGGKVLFWSLFGINSNTLQSFYRGEFDEYKKLVEEGKAPNAFGIPGLGAPTNMRGLRFATERKK